MLTKQEAQECAVHYLSSSTESDGVERVILGDPVEAGSNWVFFYQGRGYVERGDLDDMLVGNMPIVVPKDNGVPYALDSQTDVDAQIDRLAQG